MRRARNGRDVAFQKGRRYFERAKDWNEIGHTTCKDKSAEARGRAGVELKGHEGHTEQPLRGRNKRENVPNKDQSGIRYLYNMDTTADS